MDETTFRILNALSKELGKSLSINELTGKITEFSGTAYYKNIYDKIQTLNQQKIIRLTNIGNSSIASFDFSNYLLTSYLSEMEEIRKRNFLEKRIELQNLLDELEIFIQSFYGTIASICLINPEKKARLNKVEFLFLLNELFPYTEIRESFEKTEKEEFKGKKLADKFQEEIEDIYEIMNTLKNLGARYNIKIDCLILRQNDFFELATSEEKNTLQEMLSNQICIFGPYYFWAFIRQIYKRGLNLKIQSTETNLAKLNENIMSYNLSGTFGYSEFGTHTKAAEKYSLESIIASILIQGDQRRLEAIPALLAKNLKSSQRKISYNLLVYLCQKHEQLEKLAGLLEELQKILPNSETEYTLKVLQALKIKPIKADAKAIKEKMRLYNAI